MKASTSQGPSTNSGGFLNTQTQASTSGQPSTATDEQGSAGSQGGRGQGIGRRAKWQMDPDWPPFPIGTFCFWFFRKIYALLSNIFSFRCYVRS